MNDLIAGIVTVEHVGQSLEPGQELALEGALHNLLVEIRQQESLEAADACLT